MPQGFAKKFYNSKAWQDCRQAFILSKFGMCELCRQPGEVVHHKTKLTPLNIHDPDVTLNWDNLQLLCQQCHNREHGGSATAAGLVFDEEGNLLKLC